MQKLQALTRQSMESKGKEDRELFWNASSAGLYTYELMIVLADLFDMVWFWNSFLASDIFFGIKGWTHLNEHMLGKCPTT